MAGVIFSESSGLNDPLYGKYIHPINKLIRDGAAYNEQRSLLPVLFNIESSEHYGESVQSTTGMGSFKPKAEGGAAPITDMQSGYGKSFTHKEFVNSFFITRPMAMDCNVINLKQRPREFVNSYYETREIFGINLLTGAKASTVTFEGETFDTTCADGQPLFAASHPSKTGNTSSQCNIFSDAFSNTNLALAAAAMQNVKNDNGNVRAVTPDTIIIPNDGALKMAVIASINAKQDPETANNGYNINFGLWNLIILPQWDITGLSTKPWIIMSGEYNKSAIGSVWYDREMLNIISEVDTDTRNLKYNGYARWSAGFVNWRPFMLCGADGAANSLAS